MSTIITDGVGLVRHTFDDDVLVDMRSDRIITSEYVIGDMNSTNANKYTGVTVPADWRNGKYFYDGAAWTLNGGWVDPDTLFQG